MEDVALNLRSLLVRFRKAFTSCIHRNKTIVKATALTFFGIIIVSMLLTVVAFSAAPWLVEWLRSLIQSERSYIAIPPPYTENLYFYILSNNAGHFWNPIRMLVWVPLFGTLVMGLELLLNGVIIGVLSTIVGVTRGVTYPVLGLVPHGIFEIPAFVLQFASIIRWHVATIEVIMAKIVGEKMNGPKFKQSVKDVLILAVASLLLFVIAAFVETFVTPRLLGI